jgi:hypothetical protein
VVVKTQEDKGVISDLKKTFDNLSKFISRLSVKGLPFFKLLKKLVSVRYNAIGHDIILC